ncbi:MAG: co-chaperone GroES [candidate division Zixibacteria bacterium]|nr:co-chaperone GroES [candidate division Zixibacteria bacterium]
MTDVRPLGDRILVKRVEEEEVMKGGIIIPDTAKEKPQRGEVMAVGLGRLDEDGKRVPLDVKVGDSILFGKYAGNEVTIDDEEYLIMREEDVLAVVVEAKGAKRTAKKKTSK